MSPFVALRDAVGPPAAHRNRRRGEAERQGGGHPGSRSRDGAPRTRRTWRSATIRPIRGEPASIGSICRQGRTRQLIGAIRLVGTRRDARTMAAACAPAGLRPPTDPAQTGHGTEPGGGRGRHGPRAVRGAHAADGPADRRVARPNAPSRGEEPLGADSFEVGRGDTLMDLLLSAGVAARRRMTRCRRCERLRPARPEARPGDHSHLRAGRSATRPQLVGVGLQPTSTATCRLTRDVRGRPSLPARTSAAGARPTPASPA